MRKLAIFGGRFMGNDLHLNVLPARQRLLFSSLSSCPWISDFYLAGGTALALQIAHRQSIDFDFFCKDDFDPQLLKKRLINLGDFELFSESQGSINGRIGGVQISFFSIPYLVIKIERKYGSVNVISKKDIAAMKLAAISSRGSKKDFVDMYFLLQDFSLDEMFKYFEKKYGKNTENIYSALKSLVYFKDADEQPMPKMLKHVSWKNIKKTIQKAHLDTIKTL